MRAPSKLIVVVGSINTDLVVTADLLPVEGETTTGRSFTTFQGGKGANQAVAAALLDANVKMIGKVGSDAFGRESLRELRTRGVDCDHVEVEQGDSGMAVITVAAGGRNTIVVVPGANALISPGFVESKRSIIRQAGMVLAQLEVPMESVLRLAHICKEESVPLMLDPAPAAALPPGLLEMCAWFTPNETEANFYSDVDSGLRGAGQIAQALRAKGAKNLILKRGERGAYILCESAPAFEVAALQVDAVDSTAAGDTFNGAFAAALMRGRDIEFCCRLAAAAASISVTRAGAQISMPTSAEVDDAMARASEANRLPAARTKP